MVISVSGPRLQPKQLSGEVFEMGGKVTGCIPAAGKPGAFQFDIQNLEPATDQHPAWCHMMVLAGSATVPVKIAAEVCDPPYFRLFDCVAMIGQHYKRIHRLEPGQVIPFQFGVTGSTETFVFWCERMPSGLIIIADKKERMLSWGGSVGTKPIRKLSSQDHEQRRRKKLERQRRKANRKAK